jgi:hypothetical protein
MNSEFEKQLMEQPLRQTPPAWRAEILREARIAAVQQPAEATGWRSWFWPAPKAWAALAACWLVLWAANALNESPTAVKGGRGDTAALAAALAEKRRALQDVDMVIVANQVQPVVPRPRPGASSWLREEKGVLPC